MRQSRRAGVRAGPSALALCRPKQQHTEAEGPLPPDSTRQQPRERLRLGDRQHAIERRLGAFLAAERPAVRLARAP